MKRCAACGGFFDAEECPHDHSHIEGWVPRPQTETVPYPELRGRVVAVRFPGGEQPVLGVITDNEDDDGTVAFMPLHSRVRVPIEDIEEI